MLPHADDVPSAADIELIEADAWAELQLSLPRELQSRLGVSVQRRGGAVLLLASGTPTLPINRVIGLGLLAPLSEKDLDAIIAKYVAAGVERFLVQLSPAAEPANIPAWLLERGFTPLARKIAKVYRRPGPSASVLTVDPRLTVTEIGPSDAVVFEGVVAAALGVPDGLGAGIRSTIGLPGWRYYFVLDDERPIAGAALYVRRGVAWCGLGATVESDRRRGAQTALLARRLHDAAADGCVWVSADTLAETSEHPNPSYRNMCRGGFCPALRTAELLTRLAVSIGAPALL